MPSKPRSCGTETSNEEEHHHRRGKHQLHDERCSWLDAIHHHVVQRWFPRLNNWSPFNNPLKAIHKLDIPTLDWPIASFPRYKYPLEENKAEDRKCLAEVEEEFERFNKSGRFVAGVVVEPVQAGGGDVHTSLEIFQLGLTLWLVNGSPTSKSSDEPTWAAREAKQIMLPMHFPGQFADFNDYVVPSIQAPVYTIHNGQVNTYSHVDPPAHVFRQYYGFNPFHMAPVVPAQGRIGFAALQSILAIIFGGGSSSSSSSSSPTSSSSSPTSSSSSATSSSSSSATSSSSSSATSSSSSSATSSSSSSATSSSSSSATSSSSSSATSSSSSSATSSSSSPSGSRVNHVTKTALFVPAPAIVTATRLPY
ncbi:beclin-1-like protein B [Daphnia pulicaria]|uniref:beclin-1-like protein B n=1 Tax=Daphnia pulicaria TaxID=35523 RepID=UPI001EEB3BDF|nr:beclin-1-like protein B [Daphnia pulicaria]XP_046640989.1 beclin-1-like protein B [Daphnia pulicaria]